MPENAFIGGYTLDHLESMTDITVRLENGTRVFEGRWLVEPDEVDTRAEQTTEQQHYDAGAYYGVALTGLGRIAVYVAHCNGGWEPMLSDYDHLDEVPVEALPENIRALAWRALGEDYVVRLEI